MANPLPITLVANTWTKVATSVQSGQLRFYSGQYEYYHTYRLTGGAAPTGDPTQGASAFAAGAVRATTRPLPISLNADSDIYLYCTGPGKIVVEV